MHGIHELQGSGVNHGRIRAGHAKMIRHLRGSIGELTGRAMEIGETDSAQAQQLRDKAYALGRTILFYEDRSARAR